MLLKHFFRKLTPDDLAAYRELRRFALTEAPQAFVETPANDAARPDEVVAAMLARGEGWGVFEGERLMGKLVLDALPYDCLAHTRWLHAIYLHPDARGGGAAAALVGAAVAHAQGQGATRIALWSTKRTLRLGGCTKGWALWRLDASRAALKSAGFMSTTSS